MRVELDELRDHARLPFSNLLWDVKCGRPAGRWEDLGCEWDIEQYLDDIQPQLLSRWGAMV